MRTATAKVLVTLMMLGACRGDHALSKADYIKKADAICAEFSRKLSKGTSSSRATGTITIKINPKADSLWKDELRQLRALKAPKADRTRLAKIWDEAEQAFSNWMKELKATTASNPLKALTDEPKIFRREAADAAVYGLHGCGS